MECIFCKISRGEIPSTKIYENKNFFSVPDINPKVEGHTLIISKKHFQTALDIPNTLAPELLDAVKATALRLIKQYKAEGFNIVNNSRDVAGQKVDHVHFHILPRKKGDRFKIPV
jgi:histidine triad (HIT) family protein